MLRSQINLGLCDSGWIGDSWDHIIGDRSRKRSRKNMTKVGVVTSTHNRTGLCY